MKFSIKWVLLSSVIGLLMISVSTIIASSYVTSQRALLEHAEAIMQNIATFTIHEAQNYLGPAQDAAQLTQRLARSAVLSREDTAAIASYFYSQLSQQPSFAGIFLGQPSGAFIYVSRTNAKVPGGFRTKIITVQNGVRTTELIWKDGAQNELMREFDADDDYDPTERPWYVRAKAERTTIWTEPYIFYTSQQPGVTTASPVLNADGSLAGVVGVDIGIDAISTFLSKLKIGQHGRAFIVDHQGDVVAFPDLSKLKQPTEQGHGRFRLTKIDELDDVLSRQAFATLKRSAKRSAGAFRIDAPRFGSFHYEGKNYHAMFAPFTNPQWPWIIGVYLPEDDYLGAIKRNRLANVYLMLGIAAASSLIGWVIVRSVVGSMTALQLESQSIQHDDLDTTFDKRSMITEIQDTADAFTQMKISLKTSRDKTASLTQSLQEQADALRISETRYRSLVEGSIQGVLVLQERRIRFANATAAKIFGYRCQEDLRDQDITTLVEAHAHAHLDAWSINGAAPAPCDVEALAHDGGRHWLSCLPSRIIWDGAAATLVTFIDITDQRQLERDVLTAGERERQRLGQDLHDGVGQQLTGAMFLAHRVEKALAAQQHPEMRNMLQLHGLLQGALDQAYDLAQASYPVLLEAEGLHAALTSLTNQMASLYNISVTLQGETLCLSRLPMTTCIHLYRMVQEALSNAVKHGQAKHIELRVQERATGFELQIDDNGIGIPDTLPAHHGIGMRSMQYRARLIGGTLAFSRPEEGGTRISITAPW